MSRWGRAGAPEQHRLGSCGEIFATAMYMNKHNASPRTVTGREGTATVENPRVVAWGGFTDEEVRRGGRAVPPCSGQEADWGCMDFMAFQGFKTVDAGVYGSAARLSDPPACEIEPSKTLPSGVPIKRVVDAADAMDLD